MPLMCQQSEAFTKIITFSKKIAATNFPYALNCRAGYDVLALWDIRCSSLDFKSTDPTDPSYWGERWELYRAIYIGGRWFAERNISQIELYNEPDKDPECMNPAKYEDDIRIRSMAFQDAFNDHNSAFGTNYAPKLIGGTMANYWRPDYPDIMFKNIHTPFPGTDPDPNFTLIQGYSYHKYGTFSKKSCSPMSAKCRSEATYNMRKAYDNARARLAGVGYPNMDLIVSEFNCFNAGTADQKNHAYFTGINVPDLPATAACVAGQIGHMISTPGGPNTINFHRMTQSYASGLPSKISKNGIMFGSVYEAPFFLTATTKAAEVG